MFKSAHMLWYFPLFSDSKHGENFHLSISGGVYRQDDEIWSTNIYFLRKYMSNNTKFDKLCWSLGSKEMRSVFINSSYIYMARS